MRSGFINWVPTAYTLALFVGIFLAVSTPADGQNGSGGNDDPPPVCTFVADHANDREFLTRYLQDAGIFDVNNDGIAETVEHRYVGTAAATNHVVTFETGETLHRLAFRDTDMEDWLRHAYGIAWLSYDGETYRVFFKDGVGPFVWAVTRVAPDNLQDVICRFDRIVVEQLETQTGSPDDDEICSRFAVNNADGVIEFEAPPRLTYDQLDRYSPGSRHYPGGLAELDFDNDGQSEHLMAIGIASGAGRGCDLTYYDLTNSDGSEIVRGWRRDLLMALQNVEPEGTYPHSRCQGISRFIRHQGITYFEARYRNDAPSRNQELYHWVRSAQGTNATTICKAVFSVQISIR